MLPEIIWSVLGLVIGAAMSWMFARRQGVVLPHVILLPGASRAMLPGLIFRLSVMQDMDL